MIVWRSGYDSRVVEMPRNYQRKTKPTYSLEDLKKAVDDVKTKKLSIGRAATTYNVEVLKILMSRLPIQDLLIYKAMIQACRQLPYLRSSNCQLFLQKYQNAIRKDQSFLRAHL
ncbi:hypothetical protein RR48_06259 [Papilio machaon]|uniref:HTH psq-type domain-containing protein n=1 Tax=Papilio machaon TaxID=76193 RepID=A0A194R5S6_PAPMA|nr:hypothetical protein RR48_06259 [Papilio machaon]